MPIKLLAKLTQSGNTRLLDSIQEVFPTRSDLGQIHLSRITNSAFESLPGTSLGLKGGVRPFDPLPSPTVPRSPSVKCWCCFRCCCCCCCCCLCVGGCFRRRCRTNILFTGSNWSRLQNSRERERGRQGENSPYPPCPRICVLPPLRYPTDEAHAKIVNRREVFKDASCLLIWLEKQLESRGEGEKITIWHAVLLSHTPPLSVLPPPPLCTRMNRSWSWISLRRK